ncbi:MAG: hypothetical protein JXR10_15235 [Cyclobacteriaceae bacterium]
MYNSYSIRPKIFDLINRRHFLLFVLLSILGCESPINKNKENASSIPKTIPNGYRLVFSKIDNKVNVYIDDELIYTSEAIHKNPELDIEIDLTPYIKAPMSILKIDLFNGEEPYHDQLDPAWEVRYEIFYGAELLDFIHEIDDNNLLGKVLEISYVLKEEQAFRNNQ